MLALNSSRLNRKQTLISVLKALASIISICNIHVILLSKITPTYRHRPHRKHRFQQLLRPRDWCEPLRSNGCLQIRSVATDFLSVSAISPFRRHITIVWSPGNSNLPFGLLPQSGKHVCVP
jgi:hypothetical protein